VDFLDESRKIGKGQLLKQSFTRNRPFDMHEFFSQNIVRYSEGLRPGSIYAENHLYVFQQNTPKKTPDIVGNS